ncbi:hypothetical protein GF1_16650 [Desulfolithobacter dissulfuricans]|uniref:SH3b domain-containing protein n=1 Tax=Desulfolithobacter dissulfuricans TaxID=2795293 RepID=A0A915XI07_9BACT|nr:SH3 domain-containing protein [Desulfolithobacter dissulfuricans]BCO09289.1 hypothetical protein GF1_16650 [Desulfolithobacter dissulfuricans]
MKKIAIVSFFLFLVSTISYGASQKVYTKFNVSLFSQPTFDSDEVENLSPNSTVIVQGYSNSWVRVKAKSGNEGWLAKKWVSESKVENQVIKPAHERYTVKSIDKFEKIIWYENKGHFFLSLISNIRIYIGKREKSPPFLRMKVTYHGDDWLFVKSFSVLVDGKKYGPYLYDFKRDNSSAVWEWCDVYVSGKEYKLIEDIISSKEAIIRFYGRLYIKDHTVTPKERDFLRKMMLSYKSLGGKPIQEEK